LAKTSEKSGKIVVYNQVESMCTGVKKPDFIHRAFREWICGGYFESLKCPQVSTKNPQDVHKVIHILWTTHPNISAVTFTSEQTCLFFAIPQFLRWSRLAGFSPSHGFID